MVKPTPDELAAPAAYETLPDVQRTAIARAHLAQHEADHFQLSLNLAKAKAAGDEPAITNLSAQLQRTESDLGVVRDLLGSLPALPEPAQGLPDDGLPGGRERII